jgi:hypothetical protein
VITLTHDFGPAGELAGCCQPGPPAWAQVPGGPPGAGVLLLRSWDLVLAALRSEKLRNLARIGNAHAIAGVTLQKPGGLLRLAAPDTRVREALNPLWRPGQAEAYRPALRASAERHAALAAANEQADLVTGLVIPLVHDLITLAGLPRSGAPALIALCDQTTGALLYAPADHAPARQAWAALYELTGTAPVRAGSLLGRSATAMAATGLTPGQMHKGMTTIANGLPTAIPATARVLLEILRSADIRAACRADPSLIPAARHRRPARRGALHLRPARAGHSRPADRRRDHRAGNPGAARDPRRARRPRPTAGRQRAQPRPAARAGTGLGRGRARLPGTAPRSRAAPGGGAGRGNRARDVGAGPRATEVAARHAAGACGPPGPGRTTSKRSPAKEDSRMSNPQARAWRKSSHSYANGNCVEVAFRKSSHSTYNESCVEVGWQKASRGMSNGQCVEAGAGACGMVHVRDSKDPDGPVLTFTVGQWAAFTAGVKDGQLDPRT